MTDPAQPPGAGRTRARFTRDASPRLAARVRPLPRRGAGGLEIAALVSLVVGSFITGLVVLGLVLLWVSKRWMTREKALITALDLGFIAAVAVIVMSTNLVAHLGGDPVEQTATIAGAFCVMQVGLAVWLWRRLAHPERLLGRQAPPQRQRGPAVPLE